MTKDQFDALDFDEKRRLAILLAEAHDNLVWQLLLELAVSRPAITSVMIAELFCKGREATASDRTLATKVTERVTAALVNKATAARAKEKEDA